MSFFQQCSRFSEEAKSQVHVACPIFSVLNLILFSHDFCLKIRNSMRFPDFQVCGHFSKFSRSCGNPVLLTLGWVGKGNGGIEN